MTKLDTFNVARTRRSVKMTWKTMSMYYSENDVASWLKVINIRAGRVVVRKEEKMGWPMIISSMTPFSLNGYI